MGLGERLKAFKSLLFGKKVVEEKKKVEKGPLATHFACRILTGFCVNGRTLTAANHSLNTA